MEPALTYPQRPPHRASFLLFSSLRLYLFDPLSSNGTHLWHVSYVSLLFDDFFRYSSLLAYLIFNPQRQALPTRCPVAKCHMLLCCRSRPSKPTSTSSVTHWRLIGYCQCDGMAIRTCPMSVLEDRSAISVTIYLLWFARLISV